MVARSNSRHPQEVLSRSIGNDAMSQVECYVEMYGESYRDLIEDALSWIKSRNEHWGVTFDRKDEDAYVEELVSRAKLPRASDSKEQNALS